LDVEHVRIYRLLKNR